MSANRHQTYGIGPVASVNWQKAQQKAALTARWAVTMTKVRIRGVASRTHWQLVTFYGKSRGESVGGVDLLAIRKDHGKPATGFKRGDALQTVLIQVKGGAAARPTSEDAARLRIVQRDIAHIMSFSRRGRRERQRVSFACAEHLPENLGLNSRTSI